VTSAARERPATATTITARVENLRYIKFLQKVAYFFDRFLEAEIRLMAEAALSL
jgi:hypothetical protein